MRNFIKVSCHIVIMLVGVLGSVLGTMSKNLNNVWFTLGVWIVLFGLLHMFTIDKRVEKNIFQNVLAVISLLFITLAAGDMIETAYHWLFIGLIIVDMILIGFIMKCNWDNSWFSYGAFIAIYMVFFQYYVARFLVNEKHYGVIIYIVGFVSILYWEKRKAIDDYGKNLLHITSMIFMWKGFGVFGEEYEYLIPLFIALPIFLFGFLRENEMFCWVGIYTIWVYMDFKTVLITDKLIVLILMFIFIHILMKKCEVVPIIEAGIYIIEVVAIIDVLHPVIELFIEKHEIAKAVSYFVVTMLTYLRNYFDKKHDKVTLTYGIASVVLSGWGLLLLLSHTIQMARNIEYVLAMAISVLSIILNASIHIKGIYNKIKTRNGGLV